MGAIARGARKSARRLAGALEPFHTLEIAFEERRGELQHLKEAEVTRVRLGLTQSLAAVEAGGAALRWARHLLPARTPEPETWGLLLRLLDDLDAAVVAPRTALARMALRLLSAVGYGLELEACVSCARPCPPGRAATVDAGRGGIICQNCGGARRLITGEA